MATTGDETPGPVEGPQDRRNFMKTVGTVAAATAATVAGVTAAGPVFTTSVAHATEMGLTAEQMMPGLGVEVPCSCIVVNCPVTLPLGPVQIDFRGNVKVRVELDPNKSPMEAVRLKITGHKVSGQTKDGKVKVTIEQTETDLTPGSLLKIVSSFPPNFEQVMIMKFRLTVEEVGKPPCVFEMDPLAPAKLLTNMKQFPPKGDGYTLQSPITLTCVGGTGETVVIDKFPVQVGGNIVCHETCPPPAAP